MTIEQSLNILYWYKNLENEALNILSIIPYKEQNYYTIIPKIAPLIIEAGSLISTIHAFNNSQEKVFNFYKKEHKIDEVFLVYKSGVSCYRRLCGNIYVLQYQTHPYTHNQSLQILCYAYQPN